MIRQKITHLQGRLSGAPTHAHVTAAPHSMNVNVQTSVAQTPSSHPYTAALGASGNMSLGLKMNHGIMNTGPIVTSSSSNVSKTVNTSASSKCKS